jgi:hypothetical protein
MKKEKGIDDIFKHSLQDPVNEPEFAERDWDALENMLDKNDNGGKVIWLRYVSAAAAVILVAFGWWLFKPATTNTQNAQQVVQNKPAINQPKLIDTQTRQQVVAKQQPQVGNEDEVLKQPAKNSEKVIGTAQKPAPKQYIADLSNKNRQPAENGSIPTDKKSKDDVERSAALKDLFAERSGNVIAVVSPPINVLSATDYSKPLLAPTDISLPSALRPLAAAKVEVKKTSTSAFRPQFALTVLASPEVNGVGSFQSASKGTNVGLLFTVGVKKFTLSTGASYSLKPYSLPYSQYPSSYTYKNTPETVTADCRMLDIPINIGYQVYNRSNNKITLGTGISSYIMMHESYTYDYAASVKKVYGPSYYQVEGKGKYLFSIMNLQATYERQLNSKFGLSLQPYFKIPLSEIGYSQVKVQTFGVALGINWNINSLTKPK